MRTPENQKLIHTKCDYKNTKLYTLSTEAGLVLVSEIQISVFEKVSKNCEKIRTLNVMNY